MVVVARDRGHDPLSSEATVVVRIDDLNDNAPSVTIRTLHGSSATELPESSPVGSFVAHVSVFDRDSAASGHVNCSVNHAGVFALEQKYATEFQLVTAVALDRERTAHYALKVRCQDGGGVSGRGQRASRVTEKSLQVHVTDVNDNAPVFSKQTYRGSIVENSYIGASVLQVSLHFRSPQVLVTIQYRYDVVTCCYTNSRQSSETAHV